VENPKANILNTSANYHSEALIKRVEDQCIPLLPNILSDGGEDGRVLGRAASTRP
jgi:hypothetical protein